MDISNLKDMIIHLTGIEEIGPVLVSTLENVLESKSDFRVTFDGSKMKCSISFEIDTIKIMESGAKSFMTGLALGNKEKEEV
jgi:hypothetical protein